MRARPGAVIDYETFSSYYEAIPMFKMIFFLSSENVGWV